MKSLDIDASSYNDNSTDANGQTNHITLRNIKKLQVPKVQEYPPAKIIHIRKQIRLSQAALARVFNVSTSAVRQWELGDKKPSGTSKKLYDLIERKGLNALI